MVCEAWPLRRWSVPLKPVKVTLAHSTENILSMICHTHVSRFILSVLIENECINIGNVVENSVEIEVKIYIMCYYQLNQLGTGGYTETHVESVACLPKAMHGVALLFKL